MDEVPEDAERRIERRYSVATEAILSLIDPPFWQANVTVVNISGNGLLLSAPVQGALQIGARVKVRFGTTNVRGQVRHLTLNDDCLMVGIRIDDAQFDQETPNSAAT
jgi:hypothetical protein